MGTFSPRRCGIATFTSDLTTALRTNHPSLQVDVIAVSDSKIEYSDDVVFDIPQDISESYLDAADFLTQNSYDLLSVQHEYGIFGGEAGGHLLYMLRSVQIPIVTTLHTVLREPNQEQMRVMDEILNLSERVVVMSKSAVDILVHVHKLTHEKIDFIPHGIPIISETAGARLREEWSGIGPILLTFGLLSPDKGLEDVIIALPEIVRKYADAQYHIVGVTHPHELARNGEKYRESLQQLAQNLGVGNHVRFVNSFVSLELLTEYLGAIDFYLTPYRNPMQITSGTLAYSMGAGKVVISTPYVYAQEVLSENRGILVPFRSPDAVAEAVIDSWSHPLRSASMKAQASLYGKDMNWNSVASQYLDCFNRAQFGEFDNLLIKRREPFNAYQEVSLQHIERMTDDTGLIQHASYSVPNRSEGYCVDDNARALILTVMLESTTHDKKKINQLQNRYLSFLAHAFNYENCCFRNFLSYERTWLESVGSEDSQARSFWALAHMIAYSNNERDIQLADALYEKALDSMQRLNSPRACSYAVIGLTSYLSKNERHSRSTRLLTLLANKLEKWHVLNATDEWPWLEPKLAYANARIPQAMILAGSTLKRASLVSLGMQSLRWLLDLQVTSDQILNPTGSEGAGPDEIRQTQFDQQPVEAWCLLSACLTAYKIEEEEHFMKQAHICHSWFLGSNVLGLSLASPKSGGCHDGLQPTGLNKNQGAESTLSYLCSTLELLQASKRQIRSSMIEKSPDEKTLSRTTSQV